MMWSMIQYAIALTLNNSFDAGRQERLVDELPTCTDSTMSSTVSVWSIGLGHVIGRQRGHGMCEAGRERVKDKAGSGLARKMSRGGSSWKFFLYSKTSWNIQKR